MASPYMDGVRRALPIVLGYVPVAFAFGVLAVKSNIPPALVVAMSVFHFAGSGQFVCAGLWGAGVGAMSVIVAVFVVNLRHLLMSAAMAEPLAPLKRWQRFLFGCEMTDETFGVHITAFQRGWKLCTATLFTCNLTAHASWVLGTVIGVFCGGLVHDVKPLGLDYALTGHVPGPAGAAVRQPPACAGGHRDGHPFPEPEAGRAWASGTWWWPRCWAPRWA